MNKSNGRISRDRLLEELWSLHGGRPDEDRAIAAALLLDYIDDEDIQRAFDAMDEGYS